MIWRSRVERELNTLHNRFEIYTLECFDTYEKAPKVSEKPGLGFLTAYLGSLNPIVSTTTLPSASHAATAHAAIPVAAAIASATITGASTVRAWLQEPAITATCARLCEQHRSAEGVLPPDKE